MDDNSLPTQTLDIQSEIGFISLSPKKNDSCWGRLVSLNSNMSADILLIHPVHTIGRKKDCTNVLSTSKHLSQIHCKIWKDDSGIPYLEDCSSNGTYVDKKKIGKGNKIVLNNLSEISLLEQNGIFFIFKEQSESEEIYKHYDIRNQIGSGNFATVFLGISKKTSEKVAIKIIDIKRFKANSTKDVSTIKDEINILREVDHNNVIKLIDSYQTEKAVYLVLEYVSGGELFDYIVLHKGKGIGEGNAKNIFKQITNAVHYLHQKGIVHRDLKPENILIMSKEDPVVKISDFGLSRMIDESTVAKTLCGTPQYLAAEVLTKSKEGYDKKVDIWSMGVILFILLCGQHPFDESNGNILDLIKSAQYNFNDPSWNSISPEAKDLIERMIVLEPKERYDSGEVLSHCWLTGKKLSSSLLNNPPGRSKPNKNDNNSNSNSNKNNLNKRKSNNKDNDESNSTVISEEEKKEKKSKKRKNSGSNDNHHNHNSNHNSNNNSSNHNSSNSRSNSNQNSYNHSNNMNNNGNDDDNNNGNNGNNGNGNNGNNGKNNNKNGSKVGSGSFKTGSIISTSSSSSRSNSGSKSISKNDSSDNLQKTDSNYDSDGGNGDNSKKSKKVQVCKYGPSCFRKNPVHFKEFSHPWLDDDNN